MNDASSKLQTQRTDQRPGIMPVAALAASLLAGPAAATQVEFCDPVMLSYGMCSSAEEATFREVYKEMQARWVADFGIYLSQIVTFRGQQPSNRVAQGQFSESGVAAGAGGPRWNVWGAAAHNTMDYTFQPLRSSGHGDVAFGGVDYTFANDVIFGVAATLENSRMNTEFNGGRSSGNGSSFAPYVAIPLSSAWVVDGSWGWGRTGIDNHVGGVTERTTDRKTFGALSVSYGVDFGRWQIQGKGSYLRSEDHFSQTTTAPSARSRMEQLRVGGQASYDAGGFLPFAALYYIKDIGTTRQAPVAGQNAANDRDAWQLQLGVNIFSKGPLSGGLVYANETGRSQVRNDSVMANVSYRF